MTSGMLKRIMPHPLKAAGSQSLLSYTEWFVWYLI